MPQILGRRMQSSNPDAWYALTFVDGNPHGISPNAASAIRLNLLLTPKN